MPRKVEARTATSDGWFEPVGDLDLVTATNIFGQARYVGGVLEYFDEGTWSASRNQNRTAEEAAREEGNEYRLRPYEDAMPQSLRVKQSEYLVREGFFDSEPAQCGPVPRWVGTTAERMLAIAKALPRETCLDPWAAPTRPADASAAPRTGSEPSGGPGGRQAGAEGARVCLHSMQDWSSDDNGTWCTVCEPERTAAPVDPNWVLTQAVMRESQRANRLSDTCGTLRTENDELLRENARLRRDIERLGRRK